MNALKINRALLACRCGFGSTVTVKSRGGSRPPIGAPGPRVSMACLYARRPSACDEGASQHVRRRSRMRPHCASRLVYCAP